MPNKNYHILKEEVFEIFCSISKVLFIPQFLTELFSAKPWW